MSLFLITFLSLYGGMHLYAYVRIQRAFSPGRRTLFTLRCLMILGTAAPFLVRICEQCGLERTTQAPAWSGYSWMGFIFILTTLFLAADIIAILSRPFRKKRSTVFHSPPSAMAGTPKMRPSGMP